MSFFEPSTCRHKVCNYSPVAAGNIRLSSSSHPPSFGWCSCVLPKPAHPLGLRWLEPYPVCPARFHRLWLPWSRFVHCAPCPRAGFCCILPLVHVSVTSRSGPMLSSSGRPHEYFLSTNGNPFVNRKAWAELPEIELPTFTLAEIHGEFSKVLHASFESVFECIQVVSRSKLCLTFNDKNSLEETASVGLEFRGHPIALTPLHSKTG